MERLSRAVVWAFGIVLGGSGFLCADDAALELLRSKNLTREGTRYVLPGEAELAKELLQVRRVQQNLTKATRAYNTLEARSKYNERMIRVATQERRILNQQYLRATTISLRNELVARMNELTDRITLLHEGGENAEQTKQIRAEMATARSEYVEFVLGLKRIVTKTDDSYKELSADDEVTKALKAAGASLKLNLRLGPSPKYSTNTKSVGRLEKMIQTEEIELRPQSNTFWVQTIVNGKYSEEMVFDTGASLISLPAEMAAKFGLKPTDNDPTLNLRLADGRVVQGKLMSLKTVQVGKHIVRDVQCAVLPADLTAAPPLLGGSFLRNFTYKIDPDGNKLTLTRVGPATTRRR